MEEGLRQTIERVKQQNAHVMPITNMVKHVPGDIQRLIVAAERAEAGADKPTQQEIDDAAARIKAIDELRERYGLGGCYDVDEWPEYAQSEYKRLDAAQRACDAKYSPSLVEYERMKQRAEAAEAALAAVPVDALRRTLFTGYRTDAQITADADAINAWLETPMARTVTAERAVVLPAGPEMTGKTHTNEGPL